MNVLNQVTLQCLKKNRVRTAVTVVGVALSAALFTAVITFGVSLLGYMTRGAAMKYGDWHAAFPNGDAAFVETLAEDRRVEKTVAFDNVGYAKLAGSKKESKPYLFIAGYSPEAFETLPIALFSGRLPENAGEALVTGKVAAETGVRLAVGETVTLSVGDRLLDGKALGQCDPYDPREAFVAKGERTYRIVGVCQRPQYEENAAPGYTLITRSDRAGGVSPISDPVSPGGLTVFVTLKNPREARAYADETAGNAYVLNDHVLRFLGGSDSGLFNGLLYAVGGVVLAIIMVGSVFLIYNAFHISLNQRTRQFGVLMSVGATSRQLRASVLFEGLCIGAVGIPLGVLAGVSGMGLVIAAVAKTFGNVLYSNVPLTLTVSLPALLGAAAASLITILISAWLPAKKAAATPVMECIRQTNELRLESRDVKTSGLSARLYGLEGVLALKNFKRNRKRYRSIVMSLVLSVVLFVSASAFVTDMRQIAGQNGEMTTYDIALSAPDMDDGELLPLFERMKAAQGVTSASYQATAVYTAPVKASALTESYRRFAGLADPETAVSLPVTVQFLDEAAYRGVLDGLGLSWEEYNGASQLIAVAQYEENGEYGDLFSSPAMELALRPQAAPGEEAGQSLRLAFVAAMPPDTLPSLEATASGAVFFHVLAPYPLKARLTAGVPVENKGMTFCTDTPSKTAAELETILEGAAVTAPYELYDLSGLMDESRNYVFIANVFAYTFIVMISLIAAANVFNTISTNVRLRRRELAMLRSVGMGRRGFQRMMNFECAFYGMRALLWGLPLATVAAWLVYRGMFVGGAEGVAFAMPWASLGISAFSVLLIVFVTMLYAVGKVKQENIIDALRDDAE